MKTFVGLRVLTRRDSLAVVALEATPYTFSACGLGNPIVYGNRFSTFRPVAQQKQRNHAKCLYQDQGILKNNQRQFLFLH